ncbi:ankyrin repeat domain-containing protein [Psychrobacillus sp. FJAT-51614]|uniref:Ankyrin repeat domain-containing protein n=1 Tax=Psychrobacillus mangrovi TaxID=3117745 RepID=A0ABU8F3P5_9BACI
MEILLIILILLIVLGPSKLGEAIDGCLVTIFGLLFLVLAIIIFGKILGGITGDFKKFFYHSITFVETYWWLILVILIYFLLLLRLKSKNKKLSVSFWNSVSTNETTLALKLLKRKPNINYKGYTRTTPLMLASKRGNIELVEALIKSKAKLNLKNKFGDTAFVVARFTCKDDIADMLIKAGAKSTKPSKMILVDCILNNNIEGFRRCISSGISPQIIAPSGKSALELAIEKNSTVITAYLIKYGALLNSIQVGSNTNFEIRQMLSTGKYLDHILKYENELIRKKL